MIFFLLIVLKKEGCCLLRPHCKLNQLHNHAENDNGEITNSFTCAFEYLSLLPWVLQKNFYISIIF